jgi:hypothetical protein
MLRVTLTVDRKEVYWEYLFHSFHKTAGERKNKFNVHGSVHHNNILIYIQQDGKLHSLFYLETALHVSGSTITHHKERKQLYLQHLVFVTLLLLSAAIVEELELV